MQPVWRGAKRSVIPSCTDITDKPGMASLREARSCRSKVLAELGEWRWISAIGNRRCEPCPAPRGHAASPGSDVALARGRRVRRGWHAWGAVLAIAGAVMTSPPCIATMALGRSGGMLGATGAL
jgi:hypothetical protein